MYNIWLLLLLFSHSVAQSCLTLCAPMDWSMPGFLLFHQFPELAQTLSIESVISSNLLILCSPLVVLSSMFPSIMVFSNELALCIRWPKYWSFSFSISPPKEYSRLISFGIDLFDLLDDQGIFSFLHSDFFMVQLSYPYMTTGKIIPLSIQNFVGKVMSLLFNILSRFVIVFLPRSKCL